MRTYRPVDGPPGPPQREPQELVRAGVPGQPAVKVPEVRGVEPHDDVDPAPVLEGEGDEGGLGVADLDVSAEDADGADEGEEGGEGEGGGELGGGRGAEVGGGELRRKCGAVYSLKYHRQQKNSSSSSNDNSSNSSNSSNSRNSNSNCSSNNSGNIKHILTSLCQQTIKKVTFVAELQFRKQLLNHLGDVVVLGAVPDPGGEVVPDLLPGALRVGASPSSSPSPPGLEPTQLGDVPLVQPVDRHAAHQLVAKVRQEVPACTREKDSRNWEVISNSFPRGLNACLSSLLFCFFCDAFTVQ